MYSRYLSLELWDYLLDLVFSYLLQRVYLSRRTVLHFPYLTESALSQLAIEIKVLRFSDASSPNFTEGDSNSKWDVDLLDMLYIITNV